MILPPTRATNAAKPVRCPVVAICEYVPSAQLDHLHHDHLHIVETTGVSSAVEHVDMTLTGGS